LNSLAASDARVFHLSPLSRVNLGSSKGVAVLTAAGAAGAKLHDLPPYSPNFNPNEHAFLQPKAHLRKVTQIT
jgi:transposase